MTYKGIQKLIKSLTTYYPRTYSPAMTEERAKALSEDFYKAFSKYDDDAVLNAAYNWHLKRSEACTVADLYGMLYGMERISDDEYERPTRWVDVFDDKDGYIYATNTKTKEIECIWKPNWSKERRFTYKGETVVLPAKSKLQTLKEHGIVKY